MKLLHDTHILVSWVIGDPSLSRRQAARVVPTQS